MENNTKTNKKNVKFKNINPKTRTKNKKTKPESEQLKILYTNANGINGKINSLTTAMSEYGCNVACIAETKLAGQPPNIPGYTWETRNRNNKQGGGVAIITKQNLNNHTNRVTEIEDQNQEIIWIEIKNGKQKTYIGTYYGLQEHAPIEEVEREMSQITTQINTLKQKGRIILTGDFNAKLEINTNNTKQNESRNGKILNDLIKNTDLTPISIKPDRGIWTRVNRNNPNEKSVIDYILTDRKTAEQIEEIIVDEIGTHRLEGKKESDHNTILATFKCTLQPKTEKRTTWKKGTPEQWQQYNKLLNDHFKNKKPTNYDDLTSMIKTAMEKTIGKKTITIGNHKQKESSHTKILRETKKLKKKTFQLEIKTDGANKEKTLKEYINSQQKLKESINKDRRESTKETIKKLSKQGGTKSNLFWKLRKQTIGKENSTYDTITEEGIKIEDPETAKDHIANYYENLYQAREGKETHKQWTETIQQKVKDIYNKNHTAPPNITEEELNKTIKMLKKNKATGPDQIPNEIFTNANRETKAIYTQTINQILHTSNIPKQWLEGEITRLYKGKGKKGKCSNERGITLASNFGKVFERIINNRILPNINMSEAQAGGQKGKSTTDHLLILKNNINKIKQEKKTAYIAFLDVTKAYDKAWLDAIMYVMNKEGTPLNMWKIIKDLNTKLTARLKTKYGLTRRINIKDSIRQGGVLSVIQYALIMDEINKEIQKHKLGPKFTNLKQTTGCLLWMDDVALISSDTNELQEMLNITHDIASRYHIEFGATKSKILKIGKGNSKPNLHLGEMKLEYTTTYKYLGEIFNTKGNMEDHIPEIKRKTEAAYQTILTIMGNQNFNNIQMEAAWKLVETCIQPIITYGGETWKLNKKEKKTLNQIQENIIRRILMVPQSTPIGPLYMESGLLDITTITTKNRLNMEKRLLKKPNSMTTIVMNDDIVGSWKNTTNNIINRDTEDAQTITTNDITKRFQETLIKQAEGKRKTQYLLENTEWQAGKRKAFMNKLLRTEASTIFKARTRMLDAKMNFKNKYQNLKCRMCEEPNETQEHILESCPGLHTTNTTKVTKQDIFDENPNTLKLTAEKITKTMKRLGNLNT